MAEYLMDTTDLTKIASAIRTKGGTSDSLVYPDGFVTAIQAIQTGTELKIIVSVASGAAVTATKGSLSVSGTSVNGACTLVVPEEGEWTVSATLDGKTSDSKTVHVISSYDTSLAFVSTILNDNSWATIRKISDAGIGANYWNVGDYKNIQISGTVQNMSLNSTVRAFILGFNHNSGKEGSNRIHFQIGKTTSGTDIAFCDSNNQGTGSSPGFRMNLSNTNVGGWNDSYGRKTLLGNSGTPNSPPANSFMAALSADLRAVMKPVTKYTDNTGNYSTASGAVTATTDYLFFPAEFEVHGARSYANQYEQNYQAQYDYYKAGNSKVKYRHDATGTAVWYLCRSPDCGDSYRFCNVTNFGSGSRGDAFYSLGLAPGFCV